MLTAFNFKKAHKAIESIEQQIQSEMPKGNFVLVGIDNEFVYFNVAAKPTEITEQEKRDLEEKTRFCLIAKRDNRLSYNAEFKMSL